MALKIEQCDDDTIIIEGTKYSEQLFRELGCSFPNMIGQVLRVDKKDNGVVTVTRLYEEEKKTNKVKRVTPIACDSPDYVTLPES